MLEAGGEHLGKRKTQYYLMIFLGIIPIIASLVIGYCQEFSIFFCFNTVIIYFALSVAIKLVSNQYMQVEQYNLINTLALNGIFKAMLMILHFFLITCHKQTPLDILILSLQCYLLDIISLIVGCYLAERRIKRRISTYIVTIYFILIVTISGNLDEMLVVYLLRWSILLSFAVTCIMFIRCKWVSQEILHERFPIFKALLAYMIMNYLIAYIYIGQIEKYTSIMTVFHLIEAFYLFFCVFYVCISSPWEQRMNALNEAEKQIYEQGRNCDMIVNLSHELKTPVNVIRSALDMFILDLEDTEIMKCIKDIKKDCNIVMSIIQDMIDIQKINGHHIELKYQTYNLVEVIEHVMDAFSQEIVGSYFIFDPQKEEMYEAVDGTFMQQCFMLLFGLMIQNDSAKKLYVAMSQENKEERICIQIINANIPYLEELSKEIDGLNREDRRIEDVANALTLRLICAILTLHDGEMIFNKQHNEKELRIYLKRKEVGEIMWLDNRSVAVLSDQIRCRYVQG